MRRAPSYDEDEGTFSADAYRVDGYPGVAWRVLGWETEPTADTEWDGIDERTGRVVARMVGDDTYFRLEPEQVHPLRREQYCGECGQIGCTHDGLNRDSEDG
jgi:hypothetical protein